MFHFQCDLKIVGGLFIAIALAIAAPYALIAILLFAGGSRLVWAAYRLIQRKSTGIKRTDRYYLTSLCSLYLVTCLGYVSHFHSHFRTHVGGGCFNFTANESNVWGNSHRWKYGPLSDGVWIHIPYAKWGKVNREEKFFLVNVPIWIPILFATIELVLKRKSSSIDALAPAEEISGQTKESNLGQTDAVREFPNA